MKVDIQVGWSDKTLRVDLDAAFTPDEDYDGGVAEAARARARKNSEVLGRLLAHMVETKACTLEQAKDIAGVYGDMTLVEEESTCTQS